MRIRIDAVDLPGRTCPPGAFTGTDVPEYRDIHVAVQRRDRPTELLGRQPGRLIAQAADDAVDLHLPVPVANMTGGGGLGIGQIICTAANAQAADGEQPPDVDVRVHEKGYGTPWTVRCDAVGNVVPVRARTGPEPGTVSQ